MAKVNYKFHSWLEFELVIALVVERTSPREILLVSYDMCAHRLQESHYWNLVHLMSYLFVNFVTYLVSTKGKCYTCDIIIVLNELT